MRQGKALVLGASGYIGQRLVAALLAQGVSVRAAGRSLVRLKGFAWSADPAVEFCEVDVLNESQILNAMDGCPIVYYLVHSMNSQQKDFVQADRLAAQRIVRAAENKGVQRIIYLGGLGDKQAKLSKHLRSRLEVAEILVSGKVPVTTLRAAMIIGKGSSSFEIMRYLVERLPLMVTPAWVSTESQPIAVENVLNYLTGCLSSPQTIGQSLDIGGPDILSYRKLMELYAEEKGISRRLIIPVPILSPTLSSHWIQFITPYPAYIARPLAEGLKNRVVCQDYRIRDWIPQKLLTCREAIRRALAEGTG